MKRRYRTWQSSGPGSASARPAWQPCSRQTSFTAVANRILADTQITAALGGTPARDFGGEKYTATLKCHDANGEIYYVNFSRDQVSLTSYSDEAIRSRLETWADTVAALA